MRESCLWIFGLPSDEVFSSRLLHQRKTPLELNEHLLWLWWPIEKLIFDWTDWHYILAHSAQGEVRSLSLHCWPQIIHRLSWALWLQQVLDKRSNRTLQSVPFVQMTKSPNKWTQQNFCIGYSCFNFLGIPVLISCLCSSNGTLFIMKGRLLLHWSFSICCSELVSNSRLTML